METSVRAVMTAASITDLISSTPAKSTRLAPMYARCGRSCTNDRVLVGDVRSCVIDGYNHGALTLVFEPLEERSIVFLDAFRFGIRPLGIRPDVSSVHKICDHLSAG